MLQEEYESEENVFKNIKDLPNNSKEDMLNKEEAGKGNNPTFWNNGGQ